MLYLKAKGEVKRERKLKEETEEMEIKTPYGAD